MGQGPRSVVRPGVPVQWFVLFGEGQGRAWWQRFLQPGYRHCMAVRAAGPAACLTVEHVGSALWQQLHPMPAQELVTWYLSASVCRAALMINAPVPHVSHARIRPPMTCVEVVKALLGISAARIITPYQLATRLRAMGARDVAVTVPAYTAA